MTEQEEILQIFLAETEELLKLAETCLMSLESTPDSVADISELFRSIHTIKSSASMMGYGPIAELAHLLETLLDRLRSKTLTVTRSLITFLLESLDLIRSMVDGACRGEESADPQVLLKHSEQARRFLGLEAVGPHAEGPILSVTGAAAPEAVPVPSYYGIELKFRRDLLQTGRDPLLLLANLSNLGDLVQVAPDLSQVPHFDELHLYDLYISWRIILKTVHCREEIEDVLSFVREDNDIRIEDITARFKDGVDMGLADKRLGEMLVERGSVTPETLTDALGRQKRLGEILIEEGKIEPDALRDAVAQQEESRAAYRKATIRVNVEKIDEMMNLAEEMGGSIARMRALLSRGEGPRLTEISEELEYLLETNRDFQDRVCRVRMFPLEGTFRRFQRMVRDLALQQNKLVRVSMSGPDTELDKEVIETITDPLKHIARNCVDHGIELPEERTAKGKPIEGLIAFNAYRKEGRIFIEISDDGKGIDWEVIRSKAEKQGLTRPGESQGPEALLALLFKPGFTTSSTVTEISGRGVGMDVVKTHLDRLGGSITIRTDKDKGTTFVLCLPLRFTLMEVLQVRVSDVSYLVPLQVVLTSEKYHPERVKPFGASGSLYLLRGNYVPLVDLTEVFDLGVVNRKGREIVVFVDTGKRIFGICVDDVLEPQQIMTKSLETNYRSVRGVAGAAMVGDGSICLVLDPFGLEEKLFGNSAPQSCGRRGVGPEGPSA